MNTRSIDMHKFLLVILCCLIMVPAGCRERVKDTLAGRDNASVSATDTSIVVLPGAYRTAYYFPLLAEKNIGVVANHSSMVNNVHLVDTLLSVGNKVQRIFCPEHGFRGDAEAGEQVRSGIDEKTGVPVISLYGKTKKPAKESLQKIDVMVFDIQDVGARFYTYISTLHYVMEACAEENIPLILLDRPNPNGHYVDGPLLKKDYKSFIGMHPVPIVYGMTIGEYALMINGEGWLANGDTCALKVITVENYDHNTFYHLPVDPSPNLQDMHAIYLYPSICLLEGTVASVGRGTAYPFRLIGHPNLTIGDTSFLPESIAGMSTNPKFEGQWCNGWLLEGITEEGEPMLQELDLSYLVTLYKALDAGEDFFRPSFNLLAGSEVLKKKIMAGEPPEKIKESWKEELDSFKKIRKKYLLYKDFE